MIKNLLQETINYIELIGKTESHVLCVYKTGTDEIAYWEDFKSIADVEYNAGFGGNEIALNLVIQFKDGSCLKRWEYDGSEGWEYHKPFVFPIVPSKLCAVKEG